MHNLRERNKDQELGEMNIYIRTYLPANERAANSEKTVKSSILHPGPFRPPGDVLRVEEFEKNIGPAMRFKQYDIDYASLVNMCIYEI